jgi:hypothetical protein
MKFYYWKIKGHDAIHIATGYECNLNANLGPDYTWADHIADTKPWATAGVIAELQTILQRVEVAA